MRFPLIRFALVACWGCALAPTADAQERTRLPIPTVQDQTKAEALIQELYASEWAQAAKFPDARLRLALTLLQEGRDTADLPAARYLLLQHARDQATKGGDLPTALQAIQELADHFEIAEPNALAMRVRAAKETVDAAEQAEPACRIAFDVAITLFDEALAVENFASCGKALEAAEAAGRKLRNVVLVAQVRDRQARLEKTESEFAEWRPFAEKLVRNPKDRDANLQMGKYYAFLRGNWRAGLPLLIEGSDAKLAAIARTDAADAHPRGEAQALGFRWKAVADELKSPLREQVLARAYAWLAKSLPEADATQEPKVQGALDDISKDLPAELRVGELGGDARRCDGHLGPVYAVAIGPDGTRLLSAGADQTLRLWDARSGKELRRIEAAVGRIWSVDLSPRGRFAATGSFDGSVRLWDLDRGKEIRRFAEKGDYVRCVAFSPDGRSLAAAGDDRLIHLWDVATGRELGTLKGHEHFVWSIAFAPDGKTLVSGGLDRTVRIWNLETFKERRRPLVQGDTVLAVAVSPDGRRFASAGSDRLIAIWDLGTGEKMRTLPGHDGYVHAIAFSPDGRRILSGSQDQTLRLWETRTGRLVRVLQGHRDQVWAVAFSHDGKRAVSASDDKSVRIWDGK